MFFKQNKLRDTEPQGSYPCHSVSLCVQFFYMQRGKITVTL